MNHAATVAQAHEAPGAVPAPPRAHWGGVFAMSLCVFALIASEFMPVSLLTPIARDLGVSEGMAGQGIAVSGAFAVAASLSIAALAGRFDRKALLLCLTALMCVSGAVIALAPNYAVYIAGRALIGMVVGGFWSLSAATAMRLAPAKEVPRALAIFNGGNALATVVAAPLGSYLGAATGWRGAFLCLVPVALLALAWQWASLPSMPAQPRAAGAGHAFALLRSRRVVALGMAAVGVLFMGQFVLFTYVRPFLETVTLVGAYSLSMVLLGTGVAGLVGTAVIGMWMHRGLYKLLVAAPLAMALIALGLIACGASLAAVVALMAAWGLVATAVPVVWWTWLADTLPQDAETGGGLMVAVVQLAIGLGSTVGGVLYDGVGYRGAFMASAALLVVAAALAGLTARVAHSQATQLTPA